MGNNPIHILNNCHEIFVDQARIKKHKKTTQGDNLLDIFNEPISIQIHFICNVCFRM